MNRTAVRSIILALSLLLSAAGCKVKEVAVPVSTGSAPALVQVTLGASSIANGGNTTVTATVTDSNGAVIPNVSVTFSVIAATAGTFSQSPAVTNASGAATSTFTAAAAGNDSAVTIRASVTTGSTTITGSANLIIGTPAATGGAPSAVQVTLGAAAIANGGNTTVTATVTDASGVAVPSVSVTFSSISSTAGVFSPATATTNASGVASSTFTAAPAGDNSSVTIRASVSGSSGTITGSAQLAIGTPVIVASSVVVTLSSSTLSSAGGAVTVTATVLGSNSTPLSGETVIFAVSDATAGAFSAGSATTNASGVATVTFTANPQPLGLMFQISATAASLTGTATLTVGSPPPPTAASMSLSVSPAQVPIMQQATISVALLSSTGAAVYNTPITISITNGTSLGSLSTSPSVTTVNVTTNTSGNASAAFYAGISSGVVTITATSGSLSKTVSIVITSDPASVALTITDPSLVNGQTTNITASVLNAANQPVSIGTTVTFTITYSGTLAPGTLSADTSFTVTNGDAKVTFTADKVNTGPVFITATAGSVVSSMQIIQVDPASAGSLLYLTAVPSIIGLSGSGSVSDAVVTFQVMNSAGGPLANQSVNFEIVSGPPDATLDTSGGPTSSGSTDKDGNVSTILHAGSVAGQVAVKASTIATTVPLVVLSTTAGAITIGGGTPSDYFLSVGIPRFNLEGVYDTNALGNGIGCLGVTTSIQAYIADRFGNTNILTGTAISTTTDAGAIDPGNITDATGYAVMEYRTQDPAPADVAPIAGEPSYVDSSGRTRNPRDGWVSILLRTGGEEHFIDSNGNGMYDLGETFTDRPEPFIDSNDNNLWDVNEPFFDWPASVTGNTLGVYNNVGGAGNGVWDAKTTICRHAHLVMTGPPDVGPNTTHIVHSSGGTGPILLSAGTNTTFYVYVSDVNLNPLIGGTTISADMTGFIDYDVVVTPPYKVELVSGTETLADSMSYGPTMLQYRVTNTQLGPPDETGTLTITITWPSKCGALTTKVSYPGNITLFAPLDISTTALANGTVGVAYSQTLVATGGQAPLMWSMTGGALPPGLTFNIGTGVLSGMPTLAGTYTFDISITDSVGKMDTQTLDVTIN